MNFQFTRVSGAAVLSSILIAAVFATAALAAKDPFKGKWTSTDIDGSSQRLTIGGGPAGTYHVRYYVDGATVCDPGLTLAASANGSLSAAGNVLSGVLPVYCRTSPPYAWGDAVFTHTYDSSTDTLTDWLGVVWSR